MPGDQPDSARGRTYYGSARRRLLGVHVHRVVFTSAALLILSLVVLGVTATSAFETAAARIQDFLANNFGWFYLASVNTFLVFSLYLAFSRYGRIRLGGQEARPEFSDWGWYSMLFAAGTGVGILFYGVAEPIAFYADPPFGQAGTAAAAEDAMVHAFFHWGVHGWSIYALMGLALCFFCYNRGLPLTVRSGFYPLLGRHVHGPAGNLIDIAAAAGTLIGVAVSLGLGVQQINSGLAKAFDIPDNRAMDLGLIAVITAIAVASVVSGVARGIQLLSKLALIIGALVALYIFTVGPTRYLLDSLVQNLGSYVQQLPARATYAEAYTQSQWQNQWTLFYFAWWISWSPFVGMFIARISRGRTLRQYLLGVLLVPFAVTTVWLTAVGGTALHQELFGDASLVRTVQQDKSQAIFALLETLPVPNVLVLISVLLITLTVVIFFVTSSDSGALVIDIVTTGGDQDPPVPTRVFWAVLAGVVAAVLLMAGGLKALQSAATVTGLPFAAVLLLLCLSLYLGLKREWRERYVPGREPPGRR